MFPNTDDSTCKHFGFFETLVHFLNQGILLLIRGYRYLISPLLPRSCRFHPTCSAYALEAYGRFGIFRGTSLTLRRLCKCHPFHPGGVDLLPDDEEVLEPKKHTQIQNL